MVTRPYAYGFDTGCYDRKDVQHRHNELLLQYPAGVCAAKLNKNSWKKHTFGKQYDNEEPHCFTHEDGTESARFAGQSKRTSKILSHCRTDPGKKIVPAGSSSRSAGKKIQQQIRQVVPGDSWMGRIGRASKMEAPLGHITCPVDFISKKGQGLCNLHESTDHIHHHTVKEEILEDGERAAPVCITIKTKKMREACHEPTSKARIWAFDPYAKGVDKHHLIVKRHGGEIVERCRGGYQVAECIEHADDVNVGLEQQDQHNPHNLFAKKKNGYENCSSERIWGLLNRCNMDEHLVTNNSRKASSGPSANPAGHKPSEECGDILRSQRHCARPTSAYVYSVYDPPWAEYPASDCGEPILTAHTPALAAARRPGGSMCRSQSARLSNTPLGESDPGRTGTPPPRIQPQQMEVSSDAGSQPGRGAPSRRYRTITPPPNSLAGASESVGSSRGSRRRYSRDATPPPSILGGGRLSGGLQSSRSARELTHHRSVTPPRCRASQGTPPRRDSRSQSGLHGSRSARDLGNVSMTTTVYSL